MRQVLCGFRISVGGATDERAMRAPKAGTRSHGLPTHPRKSSAAITGFPHSAAFFAFPDCEPGRGDDQNIGPRLGHRRDRHESSGGGQRLHPVAIDGAMELALDGPREADACAGQEHVLDPERGGELEPGRDHRDPEVPLDLSDPGHEGFVEVDDPAPRDAEAFGEDLCGIVLGREIAADHETGR